MNFIVSLPVNGIAQVADDFVDIKWLNLDPENEPHCARRGLSFLCSSLLSGFCQNTQALTMQQYK